MNRLEEEPDYLEKAIKAAVEALSQEYYSIYAVEFCNKVAHVAVEAAAPHIRPDWTGAYNRMVERAERAEAEVEQLQSWGKTVEGKARRAEAEEAQLKTEMEQLRNDFAKACSDCSDEAALADRLANALRWYTGQGGSFSSMQESASIVLAAYEQARRERE